ncbi:MAG: DRTGG domain-containing protein [Xylanivirga thermophila]|uniref:DRTGG domain-containing protein n=1 Tax=Xylanivirga thermophila TaxID=2496273 RepID=UPI00101CC64C|nr:DRTGG domain-containing protein [Xylanivirga thermophila]
MKVRDIKVILDADILVEGTTLDKEIISACGSDLMSDVLAFVKDGTLLLTGLTNPHVIRTAEVLDVSAIVFVRGKRPSQDILDMAIERDITLLSTRYTLFDACGKLYEAGLRG